ncbi:hypothetical protein AMECASPLE_019285 [Ameca splendens]|uniref:Secreted protein n=1 Tax=Ameca splendens TaxID=208324 RepID=A0ABV0XRV5_9TELE
MSSVGVLEGGAMHRVFSVACLCSSFFFFLIFNVEKHASGCSLMRQATSSRCLSLSPARFPIGNSLSDHMSSLDPPQQGMLGGGRGGKVGTAALESMQGS